MTNQHISRSVRPAVVRSALALAGPFQPVPLDRLIAWKVEPGSRERVVVSFDEVLYGFLPSALRPTNGAQPPAIDAEWARSPLFGGRHVYLRTRDTVVKTGWTSLKDAMIHLAALPLERGYHNAFINLKLFSLPDLSSKLTRVAFVVGRDRFGNPRKEFVRVSRRAARRLLARLSHRAARSRR